MSSNSIDFLLIDVVAYNDYYPYGMQMPDRHGSEIEYRYQFMGYEGDSEVKGEGNSYTTEFRQYDPRVARWLTIDPLANKFPWQSPYVGFDNNPIFFTDKTGASSESTHLDEDGNVVAVCDSSKDKNLELPTQKTYGEGAISNFFQRLCFENIKTLEDFNLRYSEISFLSRNFKFYNMFL